jgi:hypothetical protein
MVAAAGNVIPEPSPDVKRRNAVPTTLFTLFKYPPPFTYAGARVADVLVATYP